MTQEHSNDSCLSGLRVLDMSRIVAGPVAAQMLGDMGADVIKIERRNEGDDLRTVGPPWLPGTGRADGQSTYFAAVNRNKRSIGIDFATPQGRQLVLDLAARSDILIENYKVGDLARYGLSYDDVRHVNPRIIYCSVTGFGQTGPLASRPGYDYLVQAMTGLMSITGQPDGTPGGAPMRVGVPICDVLAGQNAVISIMMALRRLDATGEGAYLDISLYESQLAALMNPGSAWINGAFPWPRSGNDHPNAVPYGVFDAADGHLMIATFTDREFVRFANAIERPEWVGDERFASTAGRTSNRTLLVGLINEITRTKPRAEWIEVLGRSKIPCGPILGIGEALDSDHARARKAVVEIPRAGGEPMRAVASPLRVSGAETVYARPSPAIGEHTEEVLGEILKLGADEISALRDAGAI
jgi:crotonobetainyl-CoA:carnitine CoA-transferase CaiB-like acyl-CoA transferase